VLRCAVLLSHHLQEAAGAADDFGANVTPIKGCVNPTTCVLAIVSLGAMLCCAVLCCAVLCCAVLSCAGGGWCSR
jgi:hypothetical protein